MKPASRCGSFFVFLASLISLLPGSASAETVPLKRIVELALSHSSSAAAAAADAQRSYAAYREARAQYIPQVVFGSGVGQSYGYPLSLEGSAPSIFNVSAQSAVFNPSLQQFIRAAREDWKASTAEVQDQRNQVMQDAVLTYAELAKWQGLIARLQEEQEQAQKMEQIIAQRVQAGVESSLSQERARLSSARIHYRMTEAQGSIDVLRRHLSDMTGLPADSIDAAPDSIPALPEIKPDQNLAGKAAQTDPAIQAADLRAAAQNFRARGERRALYPTIDFASQYALLSTTLNNYQKFFQPGSFQRHNFTIGVEIRFPFLSLPQHEHANSAEADAIRLKHDAQAVRSKVSEETLRLQRSVDQLTAAQDVAELEYKVSDASLRALQVRYDAGTASLQDVQDARDQANQRYDMLQDANFALERSRITLLRSTGEFQSWLDTAK
jgi:outer membrane protein TolC